MGRGRPARRASALWHPRHAARTRVRRHHPRGRARLQGPDGGGQPSRGYAPVLQVRGRPRCAPDAAGRVDLRPRDPRAGHPGRPGPGGGPALQLQSAGDRNPEPAVLCGRPAGHARRAAARDGLRAGLSAPSRGTDGRAARGAARACPPDHGASGTEADDRGPRPAGARIVPPHQERLQRGQWPRVRLGARQRGPRLRRGLPAAHRCPCTGA